MLTILKHFLLTGIDGRKAIRRIAQPQPEGLRVGHRTDAEGIQNDQKYSLHTITLYEFLIKRLKAFYSAAGLRPAATAAKKRSHTELQLKSLKKILIARRAWSSYETCFVISFLINRKTGSAIRRCLPD